MVKEKRSARSYLVFLLLYVCVASAQRTPAQPKPQPAQAGPARANDQHSLEQTLNWVKEQLQAHSGAVYTVSSVYPDGKTGSWKNTDRYGNFQFHGCEMTYNQSNQKDNNRPRELEIFIPLWDMATASYELDGGDKGFHYSPSVQKLLIRNHTKSMHWKRPKTYFPADQMDIRFGRGHRGTAVKNEIQRLAAALSHAASLCAAQAPKSTAPGTSANPKPVQ